MSAEDLKTLLAQGIGSGGAGKDGEEDLRALLGTLEDLNLLKTPPKSSGSGGVSMSVQKQLEQRQRQRQTEQQEEYSNEPPQPPPAAVPMAGESASRKMNVGRMGTETDSILLGGNVKFSSGSSFHRFNLMPRDDRMDSTVLNFHSDVSFRTKLGRYLTAAPTSDDKRDEERRDSRGPPVGSSGGGDLSAMAPFVLGVEGQGVGDPLDCFSFVSLDGLGRDYKGPLRYGMTVAIRVTAAKERYLGVRSAGATKTLGTGSADSASPSDTKPGFWRALPGSGERWTILKGKRGRGSVEEPESRGKFVRQGDFILLMAGAAVSEAPSSSMPQPLHERVTRDISSDDPQRRLVASLASLVLPSHLLTLHEGIEGAQARLSSRDRAGLGGELFQIDYYRSQPTPYWASRPYLCNSFLIDPPKIGSLTSGGGEGSSHAAPAAADLSTLDPALQQACMVRETLLALSGVQGTLIKVPSQPLSGSSSGSSSGGEVEMALRDAHFSVDASACSDRSLAAQVEQLLPVCDQAVVVRDFIRVHARQSHGLVSHALASSIKIIFREFDVLVAQLEHQLNVGQLSMQRMVYLLQPSARVLKLLSQLALRVWDKKGGELLDILHDTLLEQGDAKGKALVLHLFSKAMGPFLEMLRRWIFDGELHDSYSEFLVQVDRSMNRDALSDDFNAQYWESRYTLSEGNIPKVLRHVTSRILTAGKYLSVVKGCIENGLNRKANEDGGVVDLDMPPPQQLELDSEGSVNGITTIVETAYYYSSKALLKLLEEGHGMTAHLSSLSKFFLLAHGDFFVQFMDTAGEELRRDVSRIAVHRIQSLLQSALSSSTLHNDTHRDALTCSLASTNLIQHLHLIQTAGSDNVDDASAAVGANRSYMSVSGTPDDSFASAAPGALPSQGLKGVEALTLDYAVAWPLTLVLSRRAIIKYQLLSRLLFFSKHVESRVLSTWSDHQSTRELDVREAMGPAYCLRHRMLHFLHNFVYYISLEVIGARGHEMREGLAQAVDMDEVLGLHERFLDSCLKECLLASQSLLANLTKIMTTCLLFADNMKTFADQSSITSNNAAAAAAAAAVGSGAGSAAGGKREYRDTATARRARIDTQSAYVKRESEHEGFRRMIKKFESTFDEQLFDFMESLWKDSYRQHPQLANLCTRLDYNGFYSGGTGREGESSSLSVSVSGTR